MKKSDFDHTILLLQGGGALGAYQAGAYEGLVEAGIRPDWVVGISIGGINAALIAGNPPERKIERLREFWNRVSSGLPLTPPPWLDPVRPWLNHLSASSVMTLGTPGFFTPRRPPPLFFVPGNSLEELSYYDTGPLRDTLNELVDFDLINRHNMRLSLGAANVATGRSVYFDNEQTQIGPDHVRASGALPPGLPAVEIDGEYYWDGGILSNTPIMYVLENLPRQNALVLQIDIFKPDGELPEDMDELQRRALDIRFASRAPFGPERTKQLAEMHCALRRLLNKLPASFKDDPDVQQLAPVLDVGQMTIARLTNRGLSHAGFSMDYEFSRATVDELWATGLDDVRRSMARIGSMQPNAFGAFARVFELPPDDSQAPAPEPEPVAGAERRQQPGRSPRRSRAARSRQTTTTSLGLNGRRNRRKARRALSRR